MRKLSILLFAAWLAMPSWAAQVTFNMAQLTGSPANRQITLTLASQGSLAVGTNIVFNTPKKLQPIGGTVTTNLLPANYWVTIDTVTTPMFMPVPDSTNAYNAIDLIRDGLKHLVPPLTNWITASGSLLYDPAVQTVAQGTATNLYSFWHGKSTGSAWSFYNADGYTLNTNCWTYGIDFSALAAGSINYAIQGGSGDDIALITPMHGITAAHHWAGYIGMPVVFTLTNGTFFTNYVASFTVPVSSVDIELVTFSAVTPVAPFWLMPTNYSDYIPPDTLGEQVMWMRNNGNGTVTGPHMNLQATVIAPPLLSATGVADPTSPFFDGAGTSGDSGSPVFTLLWGGGALRPVFLYSLYAAWTAGPLVSWPNYWAAIQPLLGTNTANFVDLSQYQTAAPVIPPNGSTNAHVGGLPMALTILPTDDIVIERHFSPGQPVTQRIPGSSFLQALTGFPNWPPSGTNSGGGSGTNSLDIRPLDNTFSGQNTFTKKAEFDSQVNLLGTNIAFGPIWGSREITGNGFFAGRENLFTGQHSLWFSDNPGAIGSHGYGLITLPHSHSLPLAIYAGSNVDFSTIGVSTPVPVLIMDGNIWASGGGLYNLNASAFTTGTFPDARLSPNVTLMGSIFNGPLDLLQADGLGRYPALDGSQIPNLSAGNLSSGIVPNARIDRTNANFYVTSGPGGSWNIFSTNGTLLASCSNNVFTINTNAVVNGTLTVNSASNIDWIVSEILTGSLSVSNSASVSGPIASVGPAAASFTNSFYGDSWFFDSTNHAYGFSQTNGNKVVYTNGTFKISTPGGVAFSVTATNVAFTNAATGAGFIFPTNQPTIGNTIIATSTAGDSKWGASSGGTSFLLLQGGGYVLLQSGGKIIL